MDDVAARVDGVVRPWLRAAYYPGRYGLAVLQAHNRWADATPADCIFVIGCGRSGTSLLGRLLGSHPQNFYLHEPYHLWAAVDARTDFTGLYARGRRKQFLMDEADWSPEAGRTFYRLIGNTRRTGDRLLIEKSPSNAVRIGYVDALAPGARFVHIIRDGVEVAQSIARMATEERAMVGSPMVNAWWGVDDVKWRLLARDGARAGYFADEVPLLIGDTAKGAYEWLVSLGEVNRFRAHLGSRLIEVRYEDLTGSPSATLASLVDRLDLQATPGWLENAAHEVHARRASSDELIRLPAQIAAKFNELQCANGFVGRAMSTDR